MQWTEVGNAFHIVEKSGTDGMVYWAVTACGLTEKPWNQTFVDRLPSGEGAGCQRCLVATGRIEPAGEEKPAKKSKKK